jgi:hypothetical protein
MNKQPSNMQEIRENLAEAAYTAWIDKNFVNRAVVVVNAMGKIINSVALEIKAAEMNKSEVTSSMLPPMKDVKAKIGNK